MTLFSRRIRSRFIQGLKITMLSLLGIVSLVILLIFYVAGTQTGTQWLFNTASSHLNDELSFTQVNGSLMSKLQITNLNYENADIHLSIDQLVLSWRPGQLLESRFYLHQLNLNALYFEQKISLKDKQGSEAAIIEEVFELPDIILPLDIIFNNVEITQVELVNIDSMSAVENLPLIIDRISLQAEVKKSTVDISSLIVKTPDYNGWLNGWLKLLNDYPMQLNTGLNLHMSNQPKFSLNGLITGDLLSLDVSQIVNGVDSSGDRFNGNLTLNLQRLITDLTWEANVEIKTIPFRLLDEHYANNEEVFNLEFRGTGDVNTAEIQNFKVNLSKGIAVLTGNIGWQSELNWDLKLMTKNLDPSLFSADFPGDISLQLESHGSEINDLKTLNAYHFVVALKELNGTLQEQPLSGHGLIEIDKQLITVKELQLASGQATLYLNGKLDKNIDFNWRINISTLAQLIPGMTGSIAGQGKLSGSQSIPAAEGQLQVQNLKFKTHEINQAQLDFNLSTDTAFNNTLTLSVDKIITDKNEIFNTLLSIDGPLTAHSINLKSLVMDNHLNLDLRGAYMDSQLSWQGTIEQLTLTGPVIGSWKQNKPATLQINPKEAVVDQLCLFDKQASICTKANWQPAKTQVDLNLKQLNLARLKSFLPDDINELSGEINMTSNIELQETLIANIDLELKPGVFSYQLDDKKIRLKHKNGRIKVLYGKQNLTADLNLNIGEHLIQGDLTIARHAFEEDPETAAMQGSIKLNIKELGLITAFVPDIKEMQGYILADVKIGGNISEPLITGTAEFISKKVIIPVIGGEFTQLDIKLKAHNNKNIDISGQVYSGQGRLSLNGQLLMDPEKNWPLSLNMKGTDFQVLDLPELQAIITPDLELKHDSNGVKLSGRINIPKAGFYLDELPEDSKSISDDTVIVGQEAKKSKNINIDTDVTLIPGKNVHIKAFGLNTHLGGKIRLSQKPGKIMIANGELLTIDGTFRAYGQTLTLEQGRVSYAGGYLDNPGINLKASKIVQNTTVGVMASGTAKELEFSTYSSDPALDSKDITSILITGQKFENIENARVYAGTEIIKDINVGVNIGGGDEGSEFVVRYKLHKNVHIEGTSSSEKSGGNLIYTIELE